MKWKIKQGNSDSVELFTHRRKQDFADFEVYATWDGFVDLTLNYNGGRAKEAIHISDLISFVEMLENLQEKIIDHFEENPRV
jgi:hypothetical protein